MSNDRELYELLTEYGESDYYPFHMPGHKRNKEFLKIALTDITEVEGFDDLHDPHGILKGYMERAAKVFGAQETYFQVNGSAGGLLAGIFTGMRGKALLSGFIQGVKTIAPALPLIIMVIAVAYILNQGKIMHTILFHVYGLLSKTGPYGAILIIFVFIALLEFFIGSGTAKAFLVMPLVIPLAHLMGISSNTVALTFSLADGFTNLLYPTSGVMIIAIGLIGVSYGKWLRFSWKLFVSEAVVAVAVMLFAVYIGYH